MKDIIEEKTPRQLWMGLLAKAPKGRVAELLDAQVGRPDFKWLRAPEVGSTLVQGRAGGTGARFNIGEITVTRCALSLPCGTVGHAYIKGRSKACAEAAALVDALMQTHAAADVRERILTPLKEEQENRRSKRAAKASATKVDFFTMQRGEG